MKTIQIYNKPLEFIDNLVRKGVKFNIVKTSSKFRIITDKQDYTYQANYSDLKTSEMYFFKYLEKNIIPVKLEDAETIKARINYIYYNRSIMHEVRHENKVLVFNNCYEIDLNSAYWESAKRLGIINEEVYQRGLSISKKVRLMALGNLAKRPINMFFDGKKYHSERAPIPPMAKYFFACADYTDNVISSIFDKNIDFCLFYWVDALFVRSEIKEAICATLDEIEFPYKVKRIDKITFTKNYIETDYFCEKLEVQKQKVYNVEKQAIDTHFFKDINFTISQIVNSKK